MQDEIIREAAWNVIQRIHGPAVGVDLDAAAKFFREMVSEVSALDKARSAAEDELSELLKGK